LLIADGSGLIVDVARMVQGSSQLFSYLFSKSNCLLSAVCIGYAALATRELVALLLSAGAEQGMSCLQYKFSDF
jgi:hypothetical protein